MTPAERPTFRQTLAIIHGALRAYGYKRLLVRGAAAYLALWIAVSVFGPDPHPYGYPGMAQAGVGFTPAQPDGWGFAPGGWPWAQPNPNGFQGQAQVGGLPMNSGTFDPSSQGHHVIAVDGQVLNLPN